MFQNKLRQLLPCSGIGTNDEGIVWEVRVAEGGEGAGCGRADGVED